MTIRNGVNLGSKNTDYSHFLLAVETAPERFERAEEIRAFIGEQADTIIRRARDFGITVCPCDGIREVEVLLFDMIWNKARDTSIIDHNAIGDAVGVGRQLDDPATRTEVLRALRIEEKA